MDSLPALDEENEYEEDDDMCDVEEFERALRLNQQLKMMEAQMQNHPGGGTSFPHLLPQGGQHIGIDDLQLAGPPPPGRKKGENKNFTFSKQEMASMERGNMMLLKNMTKAEERRSKERVLSGAPTALQYKKQASSQVNRRRDNDRIARENMALAKRLQDAKSSLDKKAASRANSKVKSNPGMETLDDQRKGNRVSSNKSTGIAEHKQGWNDRFSYT